MTDSPPPSPASIFRAQLIVEKAKLANAKAKKGKKNSTNPATTKVATKKAAAPRSKKAVNKERVEDGQEEAQDSDKKRKPCIHYLNTLYLYLCYHPIVKAHGVVADAWMCFNFQTSFFYK